MTVSRAVAAARLSRRSAWGWYLAAGALVTLLYTWSRPSPATAG